MRSKPLNVAVKSIWRYWFSWSICNVKTETN